MLNDIYLWLRNFVVTAINAIVSFLPDTPFRVENLSVIGEYAPSIAWCVPISEIITITLAWVTAISLYYGYSVILRFVKAVQ